MHSLSSVASVDYSYWVLLYSLVIFIISVIGGQLDKSDGLIGLGRWKMKAEGTFGLVFLNIF